MSEEYIIVGVPHQRRPEVSDVFDSKEEVVDALLEHWVDDDYDLSNTDFDDAVDTVGRLTQSFTFLGFSDPSNEALEIQIRNDRNDSI